MDLEDLIQDAMVKALNGGDGIVHIPRRKVRQAKNVVSYMGYEIVEEAAVDDYNADLKLKF